jgi:hypothetical protein
MFFSKEFTDVTFIVENEQIPAHKAILACRCEQFKCMFSGQHLESQTNQITISDAKPNVFKGKFYKNLRVVWKEERVGGLIRNTRII